jgi:hypothetical protein
MACQTITVVAAYLLVVQIFLLPNPKEIYWFLLFNFIKLVILRSYQENKLAGFQEERKEDC